MTISNYSILAGREFYTGKLGDTEVVLVQSPMGKVNNAITAQLLISNFDAKALLSISPAGGIDPDIAVGDVVLATEVYQHDFGTWKPYGFIWGKVPVYIDSMTTDYNRFPGRALQVLATMSNKTGETKGRNKVVRGIIVSGDQFIASPEKRDWLQKKFQAVAVDMGAAAIAQVGYSNSVLVCLIRIITDSAGLDARTLFADSMPAYRTDIDLIALVTGFAESIIH
jgi:adenosylhomocysteine nucleosidase